MASNEVYSGTYSNVPVFEFIADTKNGPELVMRRRQDDWINATHILKVAEQQKASRTRILEREIQKDLHEKIQGGYGKFQGTWVPLQKGKELAERNGVYEKLRPLFEFQAGAVSPPQAPKHTTASSNKMRGPPKPAARPKKPNKPKAIPHFSQFGDDRLQNSSPQLPDDDDIEYSSIASESNIDEHDSYQRQQHLGGSRKRKRDYENADQQDVLYADGLLDYFMLSGSDAPNYDVDLPLPPPGFQINRHVDNQNHTALHWGAAMGDIAIVNAFIGLGAEMRVRNIRGETPLIRAVIFTNNHERDTMPQLVDILLPTIFEQDHFGGTVFHHAAALTLSHSKRQCARYYLEVLLTKLSEVTTPQEFSNFLNLQDHKGDTALHIVARKAAKKCVRILLSRGVAADIANVKGETVEQILHYSHIGQTDQSALASSSPVQGKLVPTNGNGPSKIQKSAIIPIIPATQHSESQFTQSFRDSFSTALPDKAMQIVLDIEEGFQEKETDLSEATRLLQNVSSELHQVRQQVNALLRNNGHYDDEDDQSLLEEVEALRATNESLFEQQQHKTLHMEVRTEELNLPALAHQDRTKTNGGSTDQGEIDKKVRAARKLAELQSQRMALASAVVDAHETAGMSERGETYKRLISSTMGTSAEEVSAMIPELLEVLETSKMDEDPPYRVSLQEMTV